MSILQPGAKQSVARQSGFCMVFLPSHRCHPPAAEEEVEAGADFWSWTSLWTLDGSPTHADNLDRYRYTWLCGGESAVEPVQVFLGPNAAINASGLRIRAGGEPSSPAAIIRYRKAGESDGRAPGGGARAGGGGPALMCPRPPAR